MKRNTSIKLFSLLALLALTFFFVPTAYAYEGRSGQTVTIGKTEVIDDDLYILGADIIVVDGIVNGDLVAAGNRITINGEVKGDVQLGASEIFINGKIGDDFFGGAASITLGPDAEIADDFFAGAAGVETKAGSKINGSIFIGAFQVLFAGDGAEDINVGASRMRLEGTIAGNANLSVDPADSSGPEPEMFMGRDGPQLPQVPAGLTFGNDAKIAGKLEYVSTEALQIPTEIVVGEVRHSLPAIEEEVARELSANNANPALSWTLDLLRRMVALVVIGLLVGYFASGWLKNSADKLQERPLPSLGIGFIALMALPFGLLTFIVAAILLAVLVGSLSLGNLAGLVIGFSIVIILAGIMLTILVLGYLAQMIVAYQGGRWLLNKFKPELNEKIYLPLLLGLVVIALAAAIPFVGSWIGFIVILLGLGALTLRLWQHLQKQPAAAIE